MSDENAVTPATAPEPFAVARPPRIGKPHVDEFRLGEKASLDHRGATYRITLVADDTWVVRSATGRTMGSVFVLSPAGEEGEPVYAVRLPGETTAFYEGTDWRSITAALINEVLDGDETSDAVH